MTCRKPVPKYSSCPLLPSLGNEIGVCAGCPAAPGGGLEPGAALEQGVSTLVLSLLWHTWEFITGCEVSGLGQHLALLQLDFLDLH